MSVAACWGWVTERNWESDSKATLWWEQNWVPGSKAARKAQRCSATRNWGSTVLETRLPRAEA